MKSLTASARSQNLHVLPEAKESCTTQPCCAQRLGPIREEALLSVRDLSVSYGDNLVLEEVDFDVMPNRVTGLIGPSGCGKTSFLYCLNRMSEMVPSCRVDGRLYFDGCAQDERSLGSLRRSIGMVFQRPNPFPISIRDNLILPLREHGCGKSELDDRVQKALESVGLWAEVSTRLKAPALSLSGGQQQRLCIARALTLTPKLLLMDEPCSALDPIATETIERLILGLRDELSIVIVTHNLAQAQRLADDVAVFWTHDDSGCVIESGPAEQVFDHPHQPDTIAYLAGLRG